MFSVRYSGSLLPRSQLVPALVGAVARHHVVVPWPSFHAYLRVMRNRPGFWWAGVANLIAFGRVWWESGPAATLITAAIGVAFVLLFFPCWRRLARRNPEPWSWYQPELLAEERELHPREPSSNVRRVEG